LAHEFGVRFQISAVPKSPSCSSDPIDLVSVLVALAHFNGYDKRTNERVGDSADMSDDAASSLGEKLLQAVLNLWNEVNGHGKILDHHGQEIEALKVQMKTLESKVHGLKTSKGKALAKNARLRIAIDEAEGKLRQIDAKLN
jgi:hypothetical protein